MKVLRDLLLTAVAIFCVASAIAPSYGAAAPSLVVAYSQEGTKPLTTPTPALITQKAAVKGLSVLGSPTVDVATIRHVLQSYGSPAVGEAQAIYDLGLRYGIDPAFCLAFFAMESSGGTRGVARKTHSVGNIRARTDSRGKFIEPHENGYRKYETWREGIEHWYRLITRLYVGEWGLTTLEQIIPVYAPASDGNDPPKYIDTVRRLVEEWRKSR